MANFDSLLALSSYTVYFHLVRYHLVMQGVGQDERGCQTNVPLYGTLTNTPCDANV